MIEADDVEPAPARIAQRREMIARIEQEPRRRLLRDVSTADRLVDAIGSAHQHAAALMRRRLARVREDSGDHGAPTLVNHAQRLSTAIAMPIPPPIQSDATP